MFKVTSVPTTRKAKVEFEILLDFGNTSKNSFNIEVKVEDVDQAHETFVRLNKQVEDAQERNIKVSRDNARNEELAAKNERVIDQYPGEVDERCIFCHKELEDIVPVEVLFVQHYLVGWDDLQDWDDGPMDFTPDNLAFQMRIQEVRAALIRKVVQLVNRAELLKGN